MACYAINIKHHFLNFCIAKSLTPFKMYRCFVRRRLIQSHIIVNNNINTMTDILGKHLRAFLQNLLHDRNLARLLAHRRSRHETQSHHQLPLRKGVPLPPFSRRARPPSLSQWGWTMYCVQVVRGCVPSAGYYNWCRGEGGWGKEDHEIWYWYDQVYLLWICKFCLIVYYLDCCCHQFSKIHPAPWCLFLFHLEFN